MIKLMILIMSKVSRFSLIKNQFKILENKKVYLMNNNKYIKRFKRNKKNSQRSINKKNHNSNLGNSLKKTDSCPKIYKLINYSQRFQQKIVSI